MSAVVRILIVTDDFGVGGTPHGGFLRWQDMPAAQAIDPAVSREFHLGEFCQCLENTAWVGFTISITKAHRALPGTGGLNEAALKTNRGADVVGFRFNQPFTVAGQSRSLGDYDMILFFAINYANPNPALQPEADAISRFMENGGGFFATGDHWNLGGEVAGLIPRVRSMRRWWFPGPGPNGEPGAPDALDATRHDTTQPGPDHVTNFEDQSDDVAQPIKPTLYAAGLTVRGGYPASQSLPHPLLCSPDGMVTWLPDHMHEGTCEVPGNLATRTFMLDGASNREYPDYTPANPPAGYVPGPLAPEVVATGRVVAGTTSPALDPVHTGGTIPTAGKDFGVICAWDGHLVSKGRVVVDSTWHHFFDINISGDRYLEDNGLAPSQLQKLHGFFVLDANGNRVPNNAYRMIMWYYRNIVYWLIPAKRHETIWWQTLMDMTAFPRINEELVPLTVNEGHRNLTLDHVSYFGQLAERYLSQSLGACATYVVHRHIYKPKIPWYEWIQEIVNVWDPVQKQHQAESFRAQYLGAIGAGPRPEIAATLSLGAALVAASVMRLEMTKGVESEKAIQKLQGVSTDVLRKAAGELAKVLKSGADLSRQFEKLAAAQAKTIQT